MKMSHLDTLSRHEAKYLLLYREFMMWSPADHLRDHLRSYSSVLERLLDDPLGGLSEKLRRDDHLKVSAP